MFLSSLNPHGFRMSILFFIVEVDCRSCTFAVVGVELR